MRILDRYVIRQLLMPFGIGLLVFTFLIIIPELMRYAEDYIAKGAPISAVAQIVVSLVPMSLGLTIPMSLLMALLVTFGRLSADREFVAFQACGVSMRRLLRPVGLVSILCCAATAYVLMVAVPAGNQRSREITFNIIASQAEGEVKPRMFFDRFPNIVLYVREVPPSGGWEGVFMSDNRSGEGSAVYLAKRGRIVIDRNKKTVEVVLDEGTQHSADPTGKYDVSSFDRLLLNLSPEAMFPSGGPPKGDREMSIAELRARADEIRAQGQFPHNQLFEIHKKFSIPAACLVFGLIGLALGATNRRDGKLASFVIGVAIVFAYYILLWLGQSLTKGRMLTPWLAAWLPNLVLGVLGIILFKWRGRVADRPMRVPLPAFLLKLGTVTARGRSRFFMPLGTLDRYVALTYLRMWGLSALALSSLFYISTFTELTEKVLKGAGTWTMLWMFMLYQTPQYLYYIIPLSVLLATLVTVALLTKNSELIVMKACGISLYRVALPMVAAAVFAGATIFVLEQTVLGPANRKAEAIKHVMKGGSPETFDVFNRSWVMGSDGDIYHYNYFDPRQRRFNGLWLYEFNADMTRLTRRTFAQRASYVADATWLVEEGWTREFDAAGERIGFESFNQTRKVLEPAALFTTESPDPDFMSYTQLHAYTERLRASGLDVVKQQVALWRKLSFPFVTLIMTLLAVPFAVTIGRSGAMAGIGVAIGIAIVYWTTISVFAAMGAGGVMAPALAAWAPNLLFGAGALYLLLTVRT
ncbi:MAG TPA: LPS export ABC transporter permease LptG [Vicinamibacterales bacterium]|nr:LPS export ABC transporter permease LptG [Vicinamibacterales bacterium]